jgi:hypothetical protein
MIRIISNQSVKKKYFFLLYFLLFIIPIEILSHLHAQEQIKQSSTFVFPEDKIFFSTEHRQLISMEDKTLFMKKKILLEKLFQSRKIICHQDLQDFSFHDLSRHDLYRHIGDELFSSSLSHDLLHSKASSYLKSRYQKSFPDILEKVHIFYQKHHFSLYPLLVDPGIILRFHHFYEFIEKLDASQLKIPSFSAWDLRHLYSQHLGKKIIYRALSLSDDQLISVLQQGMLSSAIRTESRHDPYRSLPLIHQNRIQQQNPEHDLLLSLTESPTIATAVASSYTRKNNFLFQKGKVKEKQSLYLFVLELPILDVIYSDEQETLLSSKRRVEDDDVSDHASVTLDDKYDDSSTERAREEIYRSVIVYTKQSILTAPFSPHVESFILYNISPDEFLELYRIEHTPYISSSISTKSEEECLNFYHR